MRRIIILLWIFCLPCQAVFSQLIQAGIIIPAHGKHLQAGTQHGLYPRLTLAGYDITIYGYITVNGSLSFSGTSNLIIYDTLVINGDLSLDNNNDLTINNNGILIVRGNLTWTTHAEIIANGYMIVTGDIIKVGPTSDGSLISNDNPVKVFIGGKVPAVLTKP